MQWRRKGIWCIYKGAGENTYEVMERGRKRRDDGLRNGIPLLSKHMVWEWNIHSLIDMHHSDHVRSVCWTSGGERSLRLLVYIRRFLGEDSRV